MKESSLPVAHCNFQIERKVRTSALAFCPSSARLYTCTSSTQVLVATAMPQAPGAEDGHGGGQEDAALGISELVFVDTSVFYLKLHP
jgi:hypothetical protein